MMASSSDSTPSTSAGSSRGLMVSSSEPSPSTSAGCSRCFELFGGTNGYISEVVPDFSSDQEEESREKSRKRRRKNSDNDDIGIPVVVVRPYSVNGSLVTHRDILSRTPKKYKRSKSESSTSEPVVASVWGGSNNV